MTEEEIKKIKDKFMNYGNEDFLHQVYKSLLNRVPDEIGYKHWINELNSKRITRIELIKKIITSDEFRYIEYRRKVKSQNDKILKINYGTISVSYTNNLDGAGLQLTNHFVAIVEKLIGKVSRICEFGAGPGFIGFSLLANGLCDSLCLIDINPEAVKICKKTIQKNKLESKVSVYLSNGLSNLPSSEKWDLVVSNPPHHPTKKGLFHDDVLKAVDKDWKIHQQFYANVKKFLKPNGSILFVENNQASLPSLWSEMISKNGLKMIDVFSYRHNDQMKNFPFYFVWSENTPPVNWMIKQQNEFTSLLQ